MPAASRSRSSNLRPNTNPVIDAALLVRAYREGIFPMALDDGEIGWFSPDPRGVIPLDTFHVPARLSRVVRSGTFETRIDTAFEAVMRACAQRPDDGTWISEEIVQSYLALFRLGLAHSVEVWRAGKLIGGLYGPLAHDGSQGLAKFTDAELEKVLDFLGEATEIVDRHRRRLRSTRG